MIVKNMVGVLEKRNTYAWGYEEYGEVIVGHKKTCRKEERETVGKSTCRQPRMGSGHHIRHADPYFKVYLVAVVFMSNIEWLATRQLH